MNFDWYKLFNLSEYKATNLISRNYQVVLDGIGQKEIYIARGNEISLIYEDVILPVKFHSANPFIREGDDASYAVFLDENDYVWLGIESQI